MSEAVLYNNGRETDLFPFNDNLDWDNEYFTPDGMIQEWYSVYSPSEPQLRSIPGYLSFNDYIEALDNGEYTGIEDLDSMVRDNIWIATAILFGRDLNAMRGSLSFNEANLDEYYD